MELKDKINKILNEYDGNFAIVVKSLNSNKSIEINEKKVYKSASLIKLFIMGEAFNEIKDGKHFLHEKIKIDNNMHVGGDGILKELNGTHEFTLEELITLMIIVSDNEATNILIDIFGMDNINKFIKALGFKDTSLNRKMMDFKASEKGIDNYTSAMDISKFFKMLYENKINDEKNSGIMIDILKRQHVTGGLDLYLGEDIAHKTGCLLGLEHDSGIVYRKDEPYIICILSNGLKANYEGKEIIGKISKLIFDEFEKEL